MRRVNCSILDYGTINFGEIGANFALQLSMRTQFVKISNKIVIVENQCEKLSKESVKQQESQEGHGLFTTLNKCDIILNFDLMKKKLLRLGKNNHKAQEITLTWLKNY